MKLLFTSVSNPEEFKWWLVSETALILINYGICISAMLLTPKLRFHIHFKIPVMFVFSQYFIFLTARLIVLGYLSHLLHYESFPEKKLILVACSWFRLYFIVMIMIVSIPLVIEKELSLYYIKDYATKTRPWIPALLIFIFISIPAICATAALLEWINILVGFFVIAIPPLFIFTFFFWNYRRTWLLNNALKNRRPAHVKYTLAVRYQLEENLYFAEGIIFALSVIAVVGLTTYISFILSQLAIFSPETEHLLLRIFHLLVAADGPVFAAGIVGYNAYFKKVIMEFFCGAVVEAKRDEGDKYFEQYKAQWEESTEKKKKSNRQKTFLMWLLCLHEE